MPIHSCAAFVETQQSLAFRNKTPSADIRGWKSKFAGMDVSQAQRLRQMEDENRRLKLLVADLSLDRQVLKSVTRKNGWSLPA